MDVPRLSGLVSLVNSPGVARETILHFTLLEVVHVDVDAI